MDLPLSIKGIIQAEKLREALISIQLDGIYCSDLERTRSTARIIASGRKTDIVEMPGLREIDLGAWDGLTREEIQRRFPGGWERRGRDFANCGAPGGESFVDLSARVIPAFQEIVQRCNQHALVVAHAGVIRVIIAHILGMPLDKIFSIVVAHGAVTILTTHQDGLKIHSLNVPVSLLQENLFLNTRLWP